MILLGLLYLNFLIYIIIYYHKLQLIKYYFVLLCVICLNFL